MNRLLSLVLLSLLLFACGQRVSPMFGAGDQLIKDREGARALIHRLAAAATMRENPEDEARYEDAKEALIARGSGIQSILFEELASHENWGVRYGIVHVLSAIGTHRMVEPLIHVLNDPEPQVAWMAMQVLRIVCDHRVVPEEAGDESARLPPIPGAGEDAETQQRLWREWHGLHGTTLREEWSAWWQENRLRVRID